MERLDEVLTRVLANCRVRMDKRKRKAGGAVEAPPEGAAHRRSGNAARQGEKSGCEGAPAQLAFRQRKGRNKRDKGLPEIGRAHV